MLVATALTRRVSHIMSIISTIQSPGPIIAVRIPHMRTRTISYSISMTGIEEPSREGTGDQDVERLRRVDRRGAWEEAEGAVSDYRINIPS